MKSFLFRLRPSILLAAALILSGCVQGIIPADPRAVAKSARAARGKAATPEEQAALYLQAAATARPGSVGKGPRRRVRLTTPPSRISRCCCAARTADGCGIARSRDTGGQTYRLRFQPGNQQGVWAPDYFTSLVLARDSAGEDHQASRTARRESAARWWACGRKRRARRLRRMSG